jgi:DNA-binding CsgD family transcriptional regulator
MSVDETVLLSGLIAEIYDTALNVASWPDVLAKLCAFIPGCASNLFSHDALYSVAEIHYSWGDDPDYVQLYFEKYLKMNPFFPAIAFDDVGRVGVQSDIVPFEEFHQTRFYQEWARPQGYVDCLYCVLEKSQTGCAMITVRRHTSHGLVDEEARRRMGLVIPHVRRAVQISRALEHSKAATGNLAELLDRMSAAIFLVGAGARVTYVNKAGGDLLKQNEVFAKRGDMLIVLDQAAGPALTLALDEIHQGRSFSNATGITVPIVGKSGQQYVAHVLPMRSGLRQRVGTDYGAEAAVFVKKADVAWASPVETIAKLYKLTPSEIRVLLAVAEEDGASQMASSLGLSEETVKTHLRHIYSKTGKRRQADLVKLLAEFVGASP